MEKKVLKIKSLSLNYILYNIRTTLDIVIPLIIFPYITRVLGPESLGKVNFAESIIGYFLIFSQLGIHSYGVREIARMRDSINDRSQVFFELTNMLLVTTLISLIIYCIMIITVPRFNKDLFLYFVILPNLLFTNFNCEWFYIGIEDQVYITIRYLAVKILQCVLIFLLIKDSNQYLIYAGILVGMNSISSIFNILYVRQYVIKIPFTMLNYKRHIRYIFAIFASTVGIQINRVLDITMIGLMIDDRSVSLYVVANRVVLVIRSLILGIVFAVNPRVENVFKSGNTDLYRKYVNTSFYSVLMLAIPATVAINILAPEIIQIIAGSQYIESIVSMRLLSAIIIIVGVANIIVSLILYPHRDENKYTIAVIVSSLSNIVFNYMMIPIIGYNGAICGTVLAESLSLFISTYYAREYLKDGVIELLPKEFLKYIVSSCFMVIIIALLKFKIMNIYLVLFLSVLICVPFYLGMLLLLKSEFATTFYETMVCKLLKKSVGESNE